MILYDTPRAPNPRRVRIFLAEKGIVVPTEAIDLAKLEHREPRFSAINPMQRLPALLLDNGVVIAESIAICRYFEEVQPSPPLFGEGALGKALVEMWQRRVELHFMVPVFDAFRHGHPAMAAREQPQFPDFAESNRPKALSFLRYLDSELAERTFVASDAFSVADITALATVDFMKPARIAMPDDLPNVARWHKLVSARPGAVL